jgi:hypothetical protein
MKEYAKVTFKGESLTYSAVIPLSSCAKIIEYIAKTEHYKRKPKEKKPVISEQMKKELEELRGGKD